MSTSVGSGGISSASHRLATGMNVQRRAAAAARIFDIIATVVLVFGGLLVLAQIAGGIAYLIASADSESGPGSMVITVGIVVGVVVVAIVTAVYWATVTLATAIAGYIAQRTPEV